MRFMVWIEKPNNFAQFKGVSDSDEWKEANDYATIELPEIRRD